MTIQEEDGLLYLAYRRIRHAYMYSLLVAALMVAALWPVVAHGILGAWLVSMGLIMSLSDFLSRRYLRHGHGISARIAIWKIAFVIASAAAGLCWGSSIFVFPTYQFDQAYLLSLFVIAGVSAFACVVVSPVFPAAVVFLLTALSPLAISLLLVGGNFQNFLSAIVLAYLVFMLLLSRQMQRVTRTSLSLDETNKLLSLAVQENNQRMSQYFQNSPGFFYTLLQHPDGRYAMPFASDGMRALFGVNPADVAEDVSPLSALAHPDDVEMVFLMTEASARNLTFYHVEYRIIHPQNGVRWIEVSSSPQRMPDGGIRWDGYMHDVTERKQMESRLVHREQAFRTLAENAPATILRYDRQCRLVYHNSHFEVTLGESAAALYGKTPKETVSDTRNDIYEAAIRRVISSGKDAESYLTMVDRFGDKSDHHFSMTAEFDDSGKVSSVLVIGYDITLSKRREEALRRSEYEYRTLAENSSDSIIRYDRECRIRYLNKSLETTLGISSTHILGKTASEVFSDGIFDELESVIGQVIASGQAADYDVILPDSGAGKHYQHLRLMPERDEHGAVNGVLSIGRDITERKRMEEVLHRNEVEFRTLAENLPAAVIRYDDKQRRRYLNPSAERMLRGRAAELLGNVPGGPTVPATPAMIELYRSEMEKVMETDAVREMEFVLDALPVGQYEYYEVRFMPEHGADGKPSGVLSIWFDITERKRVEHELRLKEDVLDQARISIYLIDENGRITYVNDEACRALGYSREVLLTKTIPEIDASRSIDETLAVRQRTMDEGAFSFETLHVRSDGSLFPVEVWASTLEYSGKTIGVALAADISERRKMELALQASERNFRSLAENLPDNVARWDMEGRYLYINPTHERTLGVVASAVIGKSIPDTHEHVKAAIAQVVATGVGIKLVRQTALVDGEMQIHEVSLVPEFDAAGHVLSVLGLGRDMTEIYRMQDAIAAREQEFRSLAESSPDVIIRVDRDLRIRYLNTNMLNYLELGSAEEVIGRQSSEIWPDGRFNEIDALRERVVTTGEIESIELAVPVSGGKMAYHQVISVPERDTDGHIIGTLTFGRDITAIRETERRLNGLVENLPGIAYVLRLSPEGEINFPYVSAGVEEIYGITPEAAMSDFAAMHGLIHPDDKPGMEALFAESVRTLTPFRIEMRICPSGQPERWLDVRSDPQAQPDGSILWFGLIFDITERKRMESELMESRNFLNRIIDSIPDPIFVKDREHRWILGNEALCNLVGQPREKLIGKSDYDFLPKEQSDVFWEKDEQVFASGVTNLNEEAITAGSGETRYLYTQKTPFVSADGQALLVGVIRDITERKHIEDVLRHSQGMLADAQKLAMLGSWDWDVIMNRVEWSEMAYEIYTPDKRPAEPDFEDFKSSLHPDDLDRVVAAVQSAFEHDTPFDLDHRVVSVSRGVRTVHAQGKVFRDVNGKPIRMVGTVQDITERKQMEEMLVSRELEARTLVENSPDTISRYNRDCRRTYANPALAMQVEGGVVALLGKKPSECPGGLNADVYENKISEVFETGIGTDFELSWTNIDGRDICSYVRLSAERDAEGGVGSVLAVGRDITELNEHRKRLYQMEFYDPLTALPNRILFNDRLSQMLGDASWHGQLAGMMLLGLDRFKVVNDGLGHSAGDALLREVAMRLTYVVRGYDTVARLGGDEFAILLPEIRSANDLGMIANKVIESFKEPFQLENTEVFVTCSIGISLYPSDSRDGDGLLKMADTAMYFAKRSGRNNFRFYSKNQTASSNERLALERDLHRGFERGELELYFQPKVDLSDGSLIGSEALLRWNHPEHGLIPPDKFISLAEDSGMIVAIGEWVLRDACRVASEWNGSGKALHKIAINLSARQFQSNDLVSAVSQILNETGCSPEWIELEITESLLLDEDGEVLCSLEAFQNMGISIAIDDFGTGYSSLSYLARYPITTLKIDRSFISRVTEGGHHSELVKAILSIAHSLQQKVVAEGVETPEQAAFLQAHGCHIGQGYLYSKPVPKVAFEVLPRLF